MPKETPMVRSIALALSALSLVAIAACTKSTANSGSAITPTGTFSTIRFVAGSPDANGGGGIDFRVDGTAVFTGLLPSSVTPYFVITPGTHTIEADAAGTATKILATTSVTEVTGAQATVVLAGRQTATPSTLQWVQYTEPAYTSLTSQFAINVHNVSPNLVAAGGSTATFGTYAIPAASSPPSTFTPVAQATFPTGGVGTSVIMNANSTVASAPGGGFYVVPSSQTPSATATPSATLLPSALDPANNANLLPYPANSDYHISLFAIDGPGATYLLVGHFD